MTINQAEYSNQLCDRAIKLKKQGKYNDAIKLFLEVLKLEPENSKAMNDLGLIYCISNDYKEAIRYFDDALKFVESKNEEYAKIWNNKGLAQYYAARDYYITNRIDENDDDPKHELNRKDLYSKAVSCFDKTIQWRDYDAWNNKDIRWLHSDAWNNKGIAISVLGWKDEALRCFKHAIELKPNNAKAWNNLGRAYSNLERYEEAINHYDTAIHFVNSHDDEGISIHADILTNKGIAFTKLGKYTSYSSWYDNATKCFEEALDMKPKNINALNHKAILYLEKGDNTRAEEIIQRSLRIQREDYHRTGRYYWNIVETLDKKATILIHLKKYEEAIKCLKEAKKYDREYGAIYVHLGYVEFRRQKYDEAINYFDIAVAKWPRFAEAHGAKALACYKKQDYKSARREAKNTIEIKPALALADENLSGLVSHNNNGSGGQPFWDFWTSSPIKKMIATILVCLGIGLIGYHFYMLGLEHQGKGHQGNILTYNQNPNSFEIPHTYLILLAIIIFVLLVPQINKAKIGSLLDIEFQPHYHPTTEAPSLAENTIFSTSQNI